jgi:hypothetical protein
LAETGDGGALTRGGRAEFPRPRESREAQTGAFATPI